MPFIIFDIETVPDEELWKSNPLTKAGKKRVKEEFAPLYAHRPIVIGFTMLDDNLKLVHLGVLADDREATLIETFTGWLATQTGTIVTFNGRDFDVPVLGLRALRHGIPQTFNTLAHRKRYDEDNHLDLFAALTEHGNLGRAGFSLDTLCRVIGLGGKGEMDGSQVAAVYKTPGGVDKIKAYCAQDCLRSAFLLARYLLMRGRISIEQYRTAARGLYDYCVTNNYTGLLFGADPTRILLETAPVAPVPEAPAAA
jgi:predicted PolB exonuclease-like 3'-5' exonuclease